LGTLKFGLSFAAPIQFQRPGKTKQNHIKNPANILAVRAGPTYDIKTIPKEAAKTTLAFLSDNAPMAFFVNVDCLI
jgi:hypothetical protein